MGRHAAEDVGPGHEVVPAHMEVSVGYIRLICAACRNWIRFDPDNQRWRHVHE
jgi:hypothetical protein